MPRWCLFLTTLLVPAVAAADPSDAELAAALATAGAEVAAIDAAIDQSVATSSSWLATRVAAEAAADGALARAGIDASYAGRWDTQVQGLATAFTADVTARAELGYLVSAGGGAGLAASAGAATVRGMLEPEAAAQTAPFELTMSYDVAGRPDLAAPRDRARATSTSAGGSVRLPLVYVRDGRNRHGFWESRLGASVTQQGARVLRRYHLDNRVYYYCRVRAGAAAPFCVDLLVWDATGVAGADAALIHELAPVRLRGVPVGPGLSLDVAVGGITNTGAMTATRDDQPIGEITSEDLPRIIAGAWDGHLHGAVGAAGLDVRWRRTGWVSLDGDLTIEDRGSAAITLRAGRTSIALAGFVADTRWWTTRDDPGELARTGGGEVTVARRIADLDVVASVGAARTFYATLDGGAPDAADLGVRAGVSISRPIWGQRAE